VLVAVVFTLRTTSPSYDISLYSQYARIAGERGFAGLYNARVVEYPPLAIGFMLAVHRVSKALPDWCFPHPEGEGDARFAQVFRAAMVLSHALAFLFLMLLHRRVSGAESAWGLCERVAAFLVAGLLLKHDLYHHLDLPLALFMVAGLALLLGRVRVIWPFALLAAGIAFKVVPMVLVPVWLIAALPVKQFVDGLTAQKLLCLARHVAVKASLLVVLLAGVFLPFCIVAGPGCLDFLDFHRARGIEFESTAAALLALLQRFGLETVTLPSHGSCEVSSALSPGLTAWTPFVAGGSLLAISVLLFVHLGRCAGPQATRCNTGLRLGTAFPRECLAYTLLLLMTFLLTNKVFSPQYVVWLLALAPLVPLEGWRRRLFLGGFVALCFLTRLICPRYLDEVLGPPLDGASRAGPTPFGTLLLIARSLLLLGLILGLTAALVRQCRAAGFPIGKLTSAANAEQ
jgi:hypothetical protein